MKGIYDDTQVVHNPARAFPILARLRTKVVRVDLHWGGPYAVAPRRPDTPADPTDPAYRWGIYDRVVTYAARYRIKVLFAIVWTPRWANRGAGMRYAPTNPNDLRLFAAAAARRYSGQFETDDGVRLARVDYWLAWNEPNNPVFLRPQYRRQGRRYVLWSPRVYAAMCNAVVRGINSRRIAAQKVACGVTAPRGNNAPRSSRPSVSPLAFLRGMKNAGARGFDAYAHHPYYAHRLETPRTPPRGRNGIGLGNIGDLVRELTRLYGRKPLWITEYGYQTPPERLFGVSYRDQARYLAQAYAIVRRHPRIDMFLWFLIRDERRLAGWQSGLMTASGRRKPAFNVFVRLR